MVTNSTAELTQLQIDIAILEFQISEQQKLLSPKPCHMEALAGNLSSKTRRRVIQNARISNQHQQEANLNVSKSSRIIFLREAIPLCISNLYNILCTVNTQHTSRQDAVITKLGYIWRDWL